MKKFSFTLILLVTRSKSVSKDSKKKKIYIKSSKMDFDLVENKIVSKKIFLIQIIKKNFVRAVLAPSLECF